ncbi:phosphoglycerate kinase [Candidatus Beckwithbacteria bacterium]|nr:phosphoglycerate kinase [Candidatus Beckwithbacteria bacterium]
MKLRKIQDIKLENKGVVLRVDYNVPVKKENGEYRVKDDTRIGLSLKTIDYILKQKPKRLVIMSHFGRPEPGVASEEFSLRPIALYLQKQIKRNVIFAEKYHSLAEREKILDCQNGEVIMLENVRFELGEEINSRSFSAKLAQLGDIFVNDAFGSCHRAHSSVVGIAEILPSYAGYLLQTEIEMIGKAIKETQRPLVAIVGGAKAATKIPVLEKLMTMADYVLLGGGVANTFLKAFGFHIGRSMYSPESLRICQSLIWKATRADTKLFMPTDAIVGNLSSGVKIGEVVIEEMPKQFQILDIGRQTQREYARIIAEAKTVIWNGPMGVNEVKAFARGTEAVYEAIIAHKHLISIVGGGDTLSSIEGHNHLENITHISTGGGAMLEYIEKGNLPGIEILEQ